MPCRRPRHITAWTLVAALVATMIIPSARRTPALAQQETGGTAAANFINPFPENDVWRGLMIGDYMADGLLNGLLDAMASEPRLQFQRRSRPLASLGRPDVQADVKAIDDIVTKEKINIAIVMLGMADRGGIRLPNGRRLAVGQGDWRRQYADNVDAVARGLRRRGVAVYWVGLPILRRPDWNEDVENLNEVIRERALGAGARYIDAFKESADENGAFSDRGPDITGKVVRLRDTEGLEFTPQGYRKLAFFIERQLKRDMAASREERAIPLAGTDAEQKRINPDAGRLAAAASPEAGLPAAAAKGNVKDARAAASPVTRALAGGAPGAADAGLSSSDVKADNVRVSFKLPAADGKEEQVTIEIVRPALTQSVIQLMTRRDKGDKASQVGDTVTDTLSNGLLVMRSVTSSRPNNERTGPRPSLTQQPFFIALAKGERLPPKPGRADDFRWPREDDLPPLPTVPVAATGPAAKGPATTGGPAGGRQARPSFRGRQGSSGERPPPSSIFQQ